MKIIGHAEGGYLIQATEGEICDIVGEHYLDYKKDEELNEQQLAFKKAMKDKRIIGQEIPISEIYRAAKYTARRWDEDRDMKGCIAHIRAMADEIEEVAKVYGIRT